MMPQIQCRPIALIWDYGRTVFLPEPEAGALLNPEDGSELINPETGESLLNPNDE